MTTCTTCNGSKFIAATDPTIPDSLAVEQLCPTCDGTGKASAPAFDIERARRAFYWNSHTPDQRAEQERIAYESHIAAVAAALTPLATTDEQRSYLTVALDEYNTVYLAKLYAVLDARARTANPMVTGRANFPTARNHKRMETERRREDELTEWAPKAQATIKRRLMAMRSPEHAEADAFAALKREIERDMATVAAVDRGEFPGFNRQAWPTGTVDKLRRQLSHGNVSLVARALDFIRDQQANWEKPYISPRSGIWQELTDAQATHATETAAEDVPTVEVITERDDLRALRNHELDRLQIIFTAKPDDTTRQRLKSTGWNWSPSNQAWQRKITNAAEYALSQFLSA